MSTEPEGNAGASSGNGGETPPTTPKVEVKEGATFLDGKKVVFESDLIAAKKSLEGQLTQQQTAHETAIDAAKLSESGALKEVATLNAKITENEEARTTGAVTDEDAARVKQELETAKSSIETLTSSSLEHRRALLVLKYGVTEDTIKEKDIAQLDAFEEALKAVSTARGSHAGPYAIGGGTGEAAPLTNIERAAKVLEATPIRGVRNEPTQT